MRFCGGLPARANATIRSPPRARSDQCRDRARRHRYLQSLDLPVVSDYARAQAVAPGVAARQRFSSLRLSVRTPPFHGGESGSIPLGSANEFNGFALALPAV